MVIPTQSSLTNKPRYVFLFTNSMLLLSSVIENWSRFRNCNCAVIIISFVVYHWLLQMSKSAYTPFRGKMETLSINDKNGKDPQIEPWGTPMVHFLKMGRVLLKKKKKKKCHLFAIFETAWKSTKFLSHNKLRRSNYLSKYDKSHDNQKHLHKKIMYLFYSITKALICATVIIATVRWFH